MESPTAKVRLLLVDDEVGYLEVLDKRLSRRGFEVLTARSGAEAIRTLRDHDVDVAVLDLKMERMDGIELLRILKQILPELKVIMLTGHGSERAARDGLAHGASDYLTKPIELDELVRRIHTALGREMP